MQNVDILLVEDNEADVILVREALKDAKVHNNLFIARDGEAAMKFLRGDHDANPDAVVPGLILLDLYLPKRDGMEILKEIKGDKVLRAIPVVMMTSSREEADVIQAYELQANSYVIKPVDFEQLTKVIRTIEDFWFSVVQLPKVDPKG